MPDNVWSGVVKINRGTSAPGANALEEGELYVNTSTRDLYTRGGKINSGEADKIATPVFSADKSSSAVTVGNAIYNSTSAKFVPSNNQPIIVDGNSHGVQMKNTSKMTLTSAMYGSTLPSTNLEVGQLFFKIGG